MKQTLNGLRVIELGSSIAAPYASWVLGAMGADVVKIERPGSGDDARGWGDAFDDDGVSFWFHSINTDKKSVAVDLSDEKERDRLRRYIVGEADVVLQNHKPGRVARLGLDSQTLLALKPELIYCNIGAFGRRGPWSERPGYDPLMQAFGGPMSVTGHPGQSPVRAGFSAVDMGTGMWAVIGILAALNRRKETGQGGVVDTALFETAVGWTQILASSPLNGAATPTPWGSGMSGIVPYQAYECADGHLVLGCGNDRLFEKFSAAVGKSQWSSDEKFAKNRQRVANREELNEQITNLFMTQPRSHWSALCDEVGVPNAPIQDISEVMAHEQTNALGLVQEVADGVRLTTLPLSLDDERPSIDEMAPGVGEHTEELLGPYS